MNPIRPTKIPDMAIAWAALVCQLGIVVTGALVRLTGSGLGCPTWPECMPGSYTPVPHPATREHAYIEFGNRLLTIAVIVSAVAAVIVGLRWARRTGRRSLLGLAAVPLAGTVVQAVVGGLTVLTGLSPWWVSAHFLVSTLVIAGTQIFVVQLQQARDAEPAQVAVSPASSFAPKVRSLTQLIMVSAAVVTVLGVVVTGSGPHAGDANVTARLPLPPLVATVLHSSAAWTVLICAFLLWRETRAPESHPMLRRASTRLLVLVLAQAALGYSQAALGLPIGLVGVHVLCAVLIWSGAVRLRATTHERTKSA